MELPYKGNWIYPPRPNIAVPPKDLKDYEIAGNIAQGKLNGSCGVLIINDDSYKFMNRHNALLSNVKISKEIIASLHRGKGAMCIIGEYLNKNKPLNGSSINNNSFVIHDICAINNKLLTGWSLEKRLSLINELYPINIKNDWFNEFVPGIHIIRTYSENFLNLWKLAQPEQLIEGLVIKNVKKVMNNPISDLANSKSQFKFRKPTKNYLF